MADQVIATETKIVHDPDLDIDRQVIAGQPVPPDLVEAYQNEGGSTTTAAENAQAVQTELTGEELAKRAAELNIEGRSKMSADELRDAVAKAEADQA